MRRHNKITRSVFVTGERKGKTEIHKGKIIKMSGNKGKWDKFESLTKARGVDRYRRCCRADSSYGATNADQSPLCHQANVVLVT